jgi:branched-chain amino acid transport system permease protein
LHVIHVVNFTLAGIMNGALYALLAVGLNLIFGVMRFINVAHGDMLTLGAYASILWALLAHPSPAGAVTTAVVTVLLAGVAVERALIAPIARDGRLDERRALVLTLGFSMFLSNLILAVFGAEYRSVPGGLASGALHLGDLTLEGQRLVVLAGSLILSALLMGFLRFTLIGLAIRATAQNAEAALSSGIDIRRIRTLSFAIGSALAAAAGALIAPITYAFPAMGFPFTLKAFIVVVVGGLGNIWGGLLTGYLLGVAESLAVLWMPTGYNAIIGPAMMLLVLILRPIGIFGRKMQRN